MVEKKLRPAQQNDYHYMTKPRQYHCFPDQRPQTPLLDLAPLPKLLRDLDESQLPQLADELRAHLLYLSLIHISEPTRPY